MDDRKSEYNKEGQSIIILAAGSSSRLGQPKQLVEIAGVPLLLKSTLTALDANYKHVVVVLGANADLHKKTIAHLAVEIITHDDWKKGMGSSLKAGLLQVIKSRPDTDAAVVMVCDQPLLKAAHLVALRDAYRKTLSPIVASRYGNTLGVPALFDRALFPELSSIGDTEGAKVVIEKYTESVHAIDWAEGKIDIDTPEDLKSLNSMRG